jgi:hypothetical protein
MTTKIFVRERNKVETGEKKPRFRIVGVSGKDLKIYVYHIRKKELEQLSKETGAEIVYLEAGKGMQDGLKERADSAAPSKPKRRKQ